MAIRPVTIDTVQRIQRARTWVGMLAGACDAGRDLDGAIDRETRIRCAAAADELLAAIAAVEAELAAPVTEGGDR